MSGPEGRGWLERPDVRSGGFLLVLAIGYGVSALAIPAGEGEPGPRALPLALAVLLAGLSTWILVGGLREAAAARRTPEAEPTAPREPGAERQAPRDERVAVAVLSTVAYAALFQPLGFLLATPLYAGTLASLFSRDRRTLVAVAVTSTAALYLFFGVILGVRLPPGPLG